MKKILLLLTFFNVFWIFSQQKFSKEISFINDNDLYVSVVRDRYYTNGMFLNYRYLSETKKEFVEKKIFQWQIGHKMFTPYKAVVTSKADHDRAFAAYLYGVFGFTNVYKTNKIFSTSVEVGVIGENAFGKELQNFIHDIYGFKRATGWEYQIKKGRKNSVDKTQLTKIYEDHPDNTTLLSIIEQHSKFNNQKNVEIVYTIIKNVHKTNTLGSVQLESQKTVVI